MPLIRGTQPSGHLINGRLEAHAPGDVGVNEIGIPLGPSWARPTDLSVMRPTGRLE